MTAAIARFKPLWPAVVLVVIVGLEALRWLDLWRPPGLVVIVTLLVLAALFFVTPRAPSVEPVELEPPVRGRWSTLNSPGSKVPSHGINSYGQRFAVDLIQPARPDAVPFLRGGLRGSRPEEYPCFGEEVLAMAPGVVSKVSDWRRDHRARNTWVTIILMRTIEGLVRSFGGFAGVAGNRIIVTHDDGTAAAYAHLRQGSARVGAGERVEAGQVIAAVGNTGNSSEPHLHVQLMERSSAAASAGIPMRWRGITADGEIDPRLEPWVKPPEQSAVDVIPANGQVFRADGPVLRPGLRSRPEG